MQSEQAVLRWRVYIQESSQQRRGSQMMDTHKPALHIISTGSGYLRIELQVAQSQPKISSLTIETTY